MSAATLTAAQQPSWVDHPAYRSTVDRLAAAPPLVPYAEVAGLRGELTAVAGGGAVVLQAGDCAESFAECSPEHVRAKLATLDRLAAHLGRCAGLPVVRIGRLGGQFAKPRSQQTELVGVAELPVFRGHLVNSELPTAGARRHDPLRMLLAYVASERVLETVRVAGGRWASHEALVLDYETSLVRAENGAGNAGATYLSSTHLPWVGDRTRQPDGAHVRLLASVANPVAAKIGQTASPAALARLCALLDPERTPGRLTLIVRLGRDRIAEDLPDLVAAVRRAGHPVIWLSDPMHANTVRTATGVKTRYLCDLAAEATAFRRVMERAGEHPGGLHLEVAATRVTECVGGDVLDEADLAVRYTTLCDPRLNPEQAHELITRVHWGP